MGETCFLHQHSLLVDTGVLYWHNESAACHILVQSLKIVEWTPMMIIALFSRANQSLNTGQMVKVYCKTKQKKKNFRAH